MKKWVNNTTPYLLILVISLLVTTYYTADLELGWIFVEFVIPIVGLYAGALVGYLFYRYQQITVYNMVGVIVFSVVIHWALMIEEMDRGVIRNYKDIFQEYKDYTVLKYSDGYKVPLDFDKHLVFDNHEDTEFNLNFTYNGTRIINENDIYALAVKYLKNQNYNFTSLKLILKEPTFADGRLIDGHVLIIYGATNNDNVWQALKLRWDNSKGFTFNELVYEGRIN